MYYIYDEKGFKGDFGSLFTVGEFDKVVAEYELPALQNLLDDGYSLDIEAVKRDLTALDFGFSELDEVRSDVLDILENCKGMIILSNGGENPL